MADGTQTSFIPYEPLPSLPEGEVDLPELAGAESYELEAHWNLDRFFTRMYKFWRGKGFYNIVLCELLNLIALLFTICFSCFLLFFINWESIHSKCIRDGTCDLADVLLKKHPFQTESVFWTGLKLTYVMLFSVYWMYSLILFFVDLPGLWDVKRFCNNRLGISERQIQWLSWPELVQRIVRVQQNIRLCVIRDLTEHDIISRILRRENYVMGMLNLGILSLNVPIPGLRRRLLLTKTLEWNLYWCILDSMFDENFRVREKFKTDIESLKRSFRRMAVANLIFAPFVLVFLVIYFLMKNAEKFYHSPSAIGARGWSPLAAWRLREFNEMPHFLETRLANSVEPAKKYLEQFPNYKLLHIGKLVAFVVGSFAALLILMALFDDSLLDGTQLWGRSLVWWGAVLTVALRISRGLVQDEPVFDPERTMAEVTKYTHYMPRHWRGRAHSKEVQEEFQKLFQYKAQIFLEEVASVVLTPFVLYFSLPKSAGVITGFIRDFSVHIDGVGDICSLAAFDFKRHGNMKYGAPMHCPKSARSRQGKMEKSFLSFVTAYPSWEPNEHAKQMLAKLAPYAQASQSMMSSYHTAVNPAQFGGGHAGIRWASTLGPNFGPWGVWGGGGGGDSRFGMDIGHRVRHETGVDRSKMEDTRKGKLRHRLRSNVHDRDEVDLIEMISMEGGGKGRHCASNEVREESRPLTASQGSSNGSTVTVSVKSETRQGDAGGLRGGGDATQRHDPPPDRPGLVNTPNISVGGGSQHQMGSSSSSWPGGGSGLFSTVEGRIEESQGVLQSFYCDHDDSVQHRLVHRWSQFGGHNSWMDWAHNDS